MMQGKSQNEKRVIASLQGDEEDFYPNVASDEAQALARIAENVKENLRLLGEKGIL
jgi:hypothetical protein